MVKVQINIQGPYSAIKFKAIEKYERENKLINLTKNKYLFGQSSEKLDLNSTIVKKVTILFIKEFISNLNQLLVCYKAAVKL